MGLCCAHKTGKTHQTTLVALPSPELRRHCVVQYPQVDASNQPFLALLDQRLARFLGNRRT